MDVSEALGCNMVPNTTKQRVSIVKTF